MCVLLVEKYERLQLCELKHLIARGAPRPVRGRALPSLQNNTILLLLVVVVVVVYTLRSSCRRDIGRWHAFEVQCAGVDHMHRLISVPPDFCSDTLSLKKPL
jgi:hypothetical protein